jgi:23S rRNA pseudouridine1911/1915/1917 synthase
MAVVVPASLAGERVDRAVALLSDLSRREVAGLVSEGRIRLNGRPVVTRSRVVAEGDRLEVVVPERDAGGLVPDASVAFEVVYEDPHLVVVDKPAGLVVHHGAGHRQGTLVDGLVARYPDLTALADSGVGDPERPGIVHRLDRGTSGLLVVARSAPAFRSLTDQLGRRTMARTYVALVMGTVADDVGIVDAPVGRSSRAPTMMTVTARGRPARTRYRVVARYGSPSPATLTPVTLIEVSLETGRTHQIRVHMAAIGHPVVGDLQYGAKKSHRGEHGTATGSVARSSARAERGGGRPFLHAARLSLDHPIDGTRLTWESPLPADLQAVLAQVSGGLVGGFEG